MRIVATLMVRDEVDIIAAMVEHHLAQGVDLIVATDNGSVDGTTEVLADYEARGVVELFHDPVHRKQQGETVTRMARRAATEHGADWVVNADADEFFVPVDRRLTLRDCLEATPLDVGAFEVPVVNLVGPPAEDGSGIDRLLWRDLRQDSDLRLVGIHAQPTCDAVHRADPEVTVAQGNHFVSVPSLGGPPPGAELEVLHLPWRSWRQFEQKVVHAGRAYEASPDLRPSRNHHGMWDYRRHREGRLRESFLLRQPSEPDLARSDHFVHDPWLRDHLHGLAGHALLPGHLAAVLDDSGTPVPTEEHLHAAEVGRKLLSLEAELRREQARADEAEARARRAARRARRLEAELAGSGRADARVAGAARRTVPGSVRSGVVRALRAARSRGTAR